MIGGLAKYGSDSESDTEPNSPPPKTVDLPAPKPPATQNSSVKPSEVKPSSGLALPPPKKRRDGPVRITVEAPKFEEEEENSERAPKKPRTATALGGKGAGSSSLFAALPAPKNEVPVAPAPARVLGGGGGPALAFSSTPSAISKPGGLEEKGTSNGLFLPPAMAKGKAKESKELLPTIAAAPAVDFFSLGTSAAPSVSSIPEVPSGSSITLTSAPEVKDFEPPVPTLYDPYPGYYQMPSGEWRAYDPGVYQKFMRQLTSGVDPLTENQTKSEAKEFAERSGDNMATFDPTEELRRGQIAERERKKAITATAASAPAMPRMKVQKATGLARTRHQLSTLLTEAYENREALEEKIAQGKRNRKEAGMKYGF